MIFTLVFFVISMVSKDVEPLMILLSFGLDFLNMLWIAFLIHFRGQRDKVAKR